MKVKEIVQSDLADPSTPSDEADGAGSLAESFIFPCLPLATCVFMYILLAWLRLAVSP